MGLGGDSEGVQPPLYEVPIWEVQGVGQATLYKLAQRPVEASRGLEETENG